MPATFYTLLHILGIFLLFFSLGGACLAALRDPGARLGKARMAATHGLGLILILVAGFGLMAKKGFGWDIWVFVKLGIWVVFAAGLTLVGRKPQYVTVWWVLFPLLGLLAAYMALYKPFAG